MYKVFLKALRGLTVLKITFPTETSNQWPPTHPKSAGKEYFYVNHLPIFLSLEATEDCLFAIKYLEPLKGRIHKIQRH